MKPNGNEQAADSLCGVAIRGARTHNLKNVSLDVPRNALVVFTGVSGSGKSSLAFDTIYAEAQRRFLESTSPYARRLIDQVAAPDVSSIDGLPPAVALRQQRASAQERSSVGSVSQISTTLRLLYSRAGAKPDDAFIPAEAFSPNTPQGACPACQGIGRVYDATEALMVPDPTLSIRDGAIASWPRGWQRNNLRDILIALGHDVDRPWQDLPAAEREWILFTDEQPTVPIFAGLTAEEAREEIKKGRKPTYNGTFIGARKYVMDNLADTSEAKRKRLALFVTSSVCPVCHGKRLSAPALAVRFAGLDIAEMADLPLSELSHLLAPYGRGEHDDEWPDEASRAAVHLLVGEICERLKRLLELGLGHLQLSRRATMLSSGELQRLRLGTQLLSKLFGVIYVLDEPSAGLHPSDVAALLEPLKSLRDSGNSVFIVEHNLDLIRQAEWLVDVGPGAGRQGGEIVHNGSLSALKSNPRSQTGRYLFFPAAPDESRRPPPTEWLSLRDVSSNNIVALDVDVPLKRLSVITGVSGSGKSTLLNTVLPRLIGRGVLDDAADEEYEALEERAVSGDIVAGAEQIDRIVRIDQRPIGRTPRSNLATYTGLFDTVRKIFAATPDARARGFDAARFSFNLPQGRCPVCEGQGQVVIEMMFMPSVTAPCAACGGKRYNAETLEVRWRDLSIADVLDLTVEQALPLFEQEKPVHRALATLDAMGLGYLTLGQPATILSGGEAQRIKLATELQRTPRGSLLYLLDEPSSGLHPADMDKVLHHLQLLVDGGHTVVMVEHDMRIAAQADWIIDLGPGSGRDGGRLVASGPPRMVAAKAGSRTAPYLAKQFNSLNA